MTMNFSLSSPSPVSAEKENRTIYDGTLESGNNSLCHGTDLKLTVISISICVASIFGLVGNGAVIWLLGFCLKRTPVTTYILNLAVADFGVLLSLMPLAAELLLISNCIFQFSLFNHMCQMLFDITFDISQFLLTVISIDRCVCVLFPIWYRCHRPEKLSTILSTLIWILYFLLHVIFDSTEFIVDLSLYLLFVDAFFCLPLITIASLILVFKFFFKTQQQQRKKLLISILLALFFFLFLSFPLKIIYLMNHFLLPYDYHYFIRRYSFGAAYLCASLNSFVNPLIYFLVGRKKRGLCGENLKLILQRVFRQEEEEINGALAQV